MVSTFVIVEMAEGGDEGIVYGLLTTTYNVGGPFASAISNQLFGLFEPKLSDPKNYVEDRPTFRNTVALSFVVTYAAAFLSLLTLPLLPRQKAQVQQWKRWDRPRRTPMRGRLSRHCCWFPGTCARWNAGCAAGYHVPNCWRERC